MLATTNDYDQNIHLTRKEWRLSKSIMNQMSCEAGRLKMNDYTDVVENLNAIWLYCTLKNRLHHSARLVDPIWQIMIEDVAFNDHEPIDLKHHYAKQKPLRGEGGRAPDTTRNMLMALGNLITVYAAKDMDDQEVLSMIKHSGIWSDLCWYYLFKDGLCDHQIEELICQRVKYRRLVA